MLKTLVLLFCLSVALGVGYSATTGTTPKQTTTPQPTEGNTTTAKSTTTPKPTKGNTTTAKSTTTPQPTKGNTTTAKSTITPQPTKGNTTTAKSTTTPQPTKGNTTTAKPTITPQPTKGNTTTAKPTTGSTTATATTSTTGATTTMSSTTTKKTTTVAPTVAPPPHGTFSLKVNNTKEYCLLAQFAVAFTIHYSAKVSKESSTIQKRTATIYLNRTNNDNVTISGDCGSNMTDAKLILSWPNGTPYYTLTMVFSQVVEALEANSNSSKWKVEMMTLDITLQGNPTFPGATEKSISGVFNGSSGPSYAVNGYYSCKSQDRNVKFVTTTANYSVSTVFEDVKLEPFVHKNSSADFGNEKFPCYQDNPTNAPATKTEPPDNNDIVPIAVGCALAGLVLIVLIAYIIGRRKSHRGYEKV